MQEKVEGKRFMKVKTWQETLQSKKPPAAMARVLSRYCQTRAKVPRNQSPTLYSKALEESADIPVNKLRSVVASVNSISRQLCSELKI